MDTNLCRGCGVIQSSLQGVAQSFGKVLFQDQVQVVPPKLNGQNCEKNVYKSDDERLCVVFMFSLLLVCDTSHFHHNTLDSISKRPEDTEDKGVWTFASG